MEVKRFVDCSDKRSREVYDKIEAAVRGSVAVYENVTEEERLRTLRPSGAACRNKIRRSYPR